MTDSEDKSDPPDNNGAPEKSGSPSTLENAVAKVTKDRQNEAEAETEAEVPAQGTNDGADSENHAAAERPRRSVGRQVIGILSVLLLLAIAYISWPVWGPALPGWLQASLAPVMGVGRGTDMGAQIAQLTAKIEPFEKDISRLKAEFAARPVVDPARLLAVDDLVRQHGEWLAKLKTDINTLSQGASGTDRADEMAALTKRLAQMETQLVTLTARPPDTTGSNTADPGAAAAAISALDALRTQSNERMSTLGRENVALRDIVAMLDQRVGAIEQKPTTASGTNRGNALVLAVGQLREAARGTAPFAVALQAVEVLAELDEKLATPLSALKPHAKTGVPDLIALRLHFNRIAGRIAHEAIVPKGEGLVDRTLSKVYRIFSFRRTGPAAAGSDDENGLVARAELRLAAGDLGTAVTILEGLKEPGLSYAVPWLKEARVRLVVDASIRTLFSEALAMTRISGDGKGAPGG